MTKHHRDKQRTSSQPTPWDRVNWDLPNLVIKQLHGITIYDIGTARGMRRHPPRWDGRSNPYGDMELLKAIQTELAKKKRRSDPPPSVERLIRRIKYRITRVSSVWKSRGAAVDWTKRDCEIAQLLGCTRERVRQVRQLFDKTPSSHIQREAQANARELATRRVIEAVRNTPPGALLTVAMLSQRLGVRKGLISTICRENGIDLGRFRKRTRKYNYQEFNWDLPNFVLRRMYPLIEVSIAQVRRKYGHPAKWNGRHMNRSCPEFKQACWKEEKKAARNAKPIKTRKTGQ